MYAAKNRMAFFEVSPLCNFNIRESFSELSRMALHRNGLERLWRSNKGKSRKLSNAMKSIKLNISIIVAVLSLQELCCRAIVPRTTVYGIEQLPLPPPIKSHLKSYAMTSYTARYVAGTLLRPSTTSHKKPKLIVPTDATRSSCVGRNSCLIS